MGTLDPEPRVSPIAETVAVRGLAGDVPVSSPTCVPASRTACGNLHLSGENEE